MSKEEQSQLASTYINQIQAKDVKNGMHVIHAKSGYCGQVGNLKSMKPGKHGHCKVIYDLCFPHNNSVKTESFKGKKGVKQARVERMEYMVSYYDEESATISCFDDGMNSMEMAIDKANKNVIAKLLKTMDWQNDGKDVYVTVLEVPMVAIKNEENVQILQIVCDVKAIEPN